MREKLNEILNKWLNAILSNNPDKMKSIFVNNSDLSSNFISIPESIDVEDLNFELNIEKWSKTHKDRYKVFFRLDVKMLFEGSLTTCDFIKFLVQIKSVDEEKLKIFKLQELVCYPWELDDFIFQKTNFGKIYWEPTINLEPDDLLYLVNNSIQKLKILFKEKHLNNINVVFFTTSKSLTDFLKDESVWAEIAGRAKGNYCFIVENEKQRLSGTIRHEISHIALERAVMMYDSSHINPSILEAVGDIAGEGFEFNSFKKSYKEILNKDFSINDLENESVHNVQDRSRKILLAVSLLDFIQYNYSIQVLLPLIKKSVKLQSLIKAIQDEFSVDLILFTKQWKDYIFL